MVREPVLVKWLLRLLAIGYVFFLVAWPTSMVVQQTFEGGLTNLRDAFADTEVIAGLS